MVMSMAVASWTMAPPRGGRYYEDLTIGDTASRQTVVTRETIDLFGEVSGDYNPVHFDADYAAHTVFREPIAHGILSAAFISAVIGMELPGPGAIYVSQSLAFKAPVRVGDVVVTSVRVAELLGRRRVRLDTACAVGGRVVLDGEAVLLVPTRPA
jgi:3-hydroxybutyryl-CoA dehydratase